MQRTSSNELAPADLIRLPLSRSRQPRATTMPPVGCIFVRSHPAIRARARPAVVRLTLPLTSRCWLAVTTNVVASLHEPHQPTFARSPITANPLHGIGILRFSVIPSQVAYIQAVRAM